MIPDGNSPQEAEKGKAQESTRERYLERGKRAPAQKDPRAMDGTLIRRCRGKRRGGAAFREERGRAPGMKALEDTKTRRGSGSFGSYGSPSGTKP